MKLIINLNTYPMEEWGEREILFLKHELNPLDVEFLEKDNSNFYEADFYFGTSFDVNWVTFIENKMKLVIFPSQAKVNQELKQVLFNKKIPIIDCMPTTGIVNDKYTFYAIRYLIVVIRQYIEFERGINFKYAKKEYWYAAVCKLFNNKRINNLIDYTTEDYVQHKDFFEYCDMSKAKLLDAFKQSKRRWPYLALTVNSSCNRKCIFCDAKNADNGLISVDNYCEIASIANSWEIEKVHLSGGEPTMLGKVVDIVGVFNKELTSHKKQIGITTNGSCSINLIERLIDAGLTNINFSIHSLNETNYRKIMGTGSVQEVLSKVLFCIEKNLKVKVNCTLLRSYVNDAVDMLRLAEEYPIDLRFVELQRIGPAVKFFDDEFISEDEVRNIEIVSNKFKQLASVKSRVQNGVRSPGQYIQFNGWKGSVAFISNTSRPICMDANRIKITPTGRLRPCTFRNSDINLKDHFNVDLDEVFRRVFFAIYNRNCNPDFCGVHYIDYDLRWDNYKFY